MSQEAELETLICGQALRLKTRETFLSWGEMVYEGDPIGVSCLRIKEPEAWQEGVGAHPRPPGFHPCSQRRKPLAFPAFP